MLIIWISIALMAGGGLTYWSGLLSTETGSGSGTGTETGSELLEIVNVTSRKSGSLDLTIRNRGTIDARLEYIVANGTVVNEEDHIVPYGSEIKIEIQIPLSFEPNSLLTMRLHTKSGKDFEGTIIVPRPPGFVKIEIPTAYAQAVDDGWEIIFVLRNSGSGDTAIDEIFVDKPVTMPELPIDLSSGVTVTLKWFLSSERASPGTVVQVRVHTTEGKEYGKNIGLP